MVFFSELDENIQVFIFAQLAALQFLLQWL